MPGTIRSMMIASNFDEVAGKEPVWAVLYMLDGEPVLTQTVKGVVCSGLVVLDEQDPAGHCTSVATPRKNGEAGLGGESRPRHDGKRGAPRRRLSLARGLGRNGLHGRLRAQSRTINRWSWRLRWHLQVTLQRDCVLDDGLL